ncbi:hypothetical protein EJ02DRAFT_425658 [Clathrospora elynae]|uniref:Uncharacterized protein n=1 Tax=Clathrospora elynae TaxID=706981 RepID=A0A6A5SFR1_9PLEO|nr:hypothetical protein EJ02DRAFT_425658 [Clathrospora elynae]
MVTTQASAEVPEGLPQSPTEGSAMVEESTPTEAGPSQPASGVSTQEPTTITNIATLDAEIRAAEEQLEITRKLKQLEHLRAQQQAVEAGDANALQGIPTLANPAPTSSMGTHMPTTAPRIPRPDPPPQFEGKNRAQLNDWIRGCERFFTPENGLHTGTAQTAFASGYLGTH